MSETPLARWEGWEAAELASRWGAAAVQLRATIGSTNELARRLAAEGAPDGAVVLAEEQTAGRGQAGRSWSSPAGLGLWVSVVRRPVGAFLPGVLPLRVGLAVAEALDPMLAPTRVELKWPNDLLVVGRKVGGILCEAVWEGDRAAAVVIGVGINVLHAAIDFPAELRDSATSLARCAGAEVARIAAADAAIAAVLAVELSDRPLDPAERARLSARDALRDTEVTVSDPASGAPLLFGVAEGVERDGSLRLRLPDGGERAVFSGTVRPVGGFASSTARP